MDLMKLIVNRFGLLYVTSIRLIVPLSLSSALILRPIIR